MDNKMREVAKILGIELGNQFEIKNKNCSKKYVLNNGGLFSKSPTSLDEWELSNDILKKLLTNELQIEWRPVENETVWVVDARYDKPLRINYCDSIPNRLSKKRGMLVRTKTEAMDKMEELGWL